MRENISPEEKLLRLIKGQKKQGMSFDKGAVVAASSPASKAVAKRPAYSLIQNYLSLNFKIILVVLFILSCAYLISSFLYPWFAPEKIKLPEAMSGNSNQPQVEPKLDIKPYDFYADTIVNRQIFGSKDLQEAGEPGVSPNVDLVKDINLLGIVSGENPQAIIEDKKTQKIYYLNKGQFIGEYQLEEMLEGKIILNYKGQRFELYL